MLEGIFRDDIQKIITEKVNWKVVNEIRIRNDKPIILSVGANKFFLCENGLTGDLKKAIFATKTMIEDVIFRASEFSIYSVNEQIKKGFIMTTKGVRIGIAGNMIEEAGQVKTMTNFSSLNIRIPHEIRNCSLKTYGKLQKNNKILNTLIISPPGAGKTTFLRDFIWQLSDRNMAYNVLVLDERGEIDIGRKNCLGNFCDVISFASKKTGFENGIRSLAPDLIVTDELSDDDVKYVKQAINCGISIIASVHSSSVEEVCKKPAFEKILQEKAFERFVVLSNREGPGTFEGVYNENFSRVQNYD